MALKRLFQLDAAGPREAANGRRAGPEAGRRSGGHSGVQFGIFSDVDCVQRGREFDFGRRVHSNSHLDLASGSGATLTLRDKVSSVREVVRRFLSRREPVVGRADRRGQHDARQLDRAVPGTDGDEGA